MLLSCLKSEEFSSSVYLQSQNLNTIANRNMIYEDMISSQPHYRLPSNTLSSSNDRSGALNSTTSIHNASSTTSTCSSASSLSYYQLPLDTYDQSINYQDEQLYYALQLNGNPSSGMMMEGGMNNSHIKADNNMKSSLYKTELCKRFVQYGNCRYGAKCQFAHGMTELRQVLRHPKYKTTRCKSFWGTGQCPYGIRCRFIHEEGDYYCYSNNQQNDYHVASHEMQDLTNQMHMLSTSNSESSMKNLQSHCDSINNDDDIDEDTELSKEYHRANSQHSPQSPASTLTNILSPISPLSTLSSYLGENDHESEHCNNSNLSSSSSSSFSPSSSTLSLLSKEKVFGADYKLWKMGNQETGEFSLCYDMKNDSENPALDEDLSSSPSIASNGDRSSYLYENSHNLESFLLDVNLPNIPLSSSVVLLSEENAKINNATSVSLPDTAKDSLFAGQNTPSMRIGEHVLQYENKENVANYLFEEENNDDALLPQKLGGCHNGRLRIFQAFTRVKE